LNGAWLNFVENSRRIEAKRSGFVESSAIQILPTGKRKEEALLTVVVAVLLRKRDRWLAKRSSEFQNYLSSATIESCLVFNKRNFVSSSFSGLLFFYPQ
jgi:hypothetical protein